ncbi:hypothetical protein HZB00_01715 [Candidatus Woesearchaeota archaeon]|nr:hypothetical protein [Candidatus Woesearchaeota archaeon]
MRDELWLHQRLEQIWQLLFPEVERKNTVLIRFKGRWKNKFGHIKRLKDGSSEIVINRHFQQEWVPEYIIDLTIAHELVHYMHGFNSPHPKLYKHPHAGGIVNKELKKRGFEHMLKRENEWIKNEWRKTIEIQQPRRQQRLFRWW